MNYKVESSFKLEDDSAVFASRILDGQQEWDSLDVGQDTRERQELQYNMPLSP
jgi:hypothetical protein